MSKVELIDEENPWQFKSRDVKYDNPWIHVEEHQVIDPKGNDAIYGVVSAKHLAIGIIPLDGDYNTWLVGQYRYPLRKYSWEIVEGGGHHDVDPLETARRELKEETGIEAKEYQHIITIHTSNCIADEKAIIYVAKSLSFGESNPDDNEQLQVAKIPFEQAYQYVLEGRITDSMSVSGILRTKILMEEGVI